SFAPPLPPFPRNTHPGSLFTDASGRLLFTSSPPMVVVSPGGDQRVEEDEAPFASGFSPHRPHAALASGHLLLGESAGPWVAALDGLPLAAPPQFLESSISVAAPSRGGLFLLTQGAPDGILRAYA